MVHQPSGGAHGQAADIAIHAKEILAMRDRLNQLYVNHTGQDHKAIGEEFLEPALQINLEKLTSRASFPFSFYCRERLGP